jgi:hypothetical protein
VDSLALIVAASTLLALSLVAGALLRAWQGWLDVRQLQLGAAPDLTSGEVRELRQRVRKLERIALGLD